jgi:hypothetical protein
MDFSTTRDKVILGAIIVIVIGVLYFAWTKSVPPEPVLPAGQSLHNPMGIQHGGRAERR